MLQARASLTGTNAGEPSDCSESFERLAGLSGHWTGSWMNHTFNSNGTVSCAQTGLCLEVNGGATANGSAVIVWNCHGGTNQRWSRA